MECHACGHDNRDTARFCDQCGTRLAGSAAETSARAAAATAYTPRHLRDEVFRLRSALEGEHKLVTVFFIDIRDSLRLSEQVDAEQWHGLLDQFFAVVTEAVHRFDGTINQYTGDGVMALFGAPRAQEDHARRAACASLYVRRGLQQLAAKLDASHGLELTIRIGLSSGPVVVGKIGDNLRMDYTAQGPTVALAARMEALAGADQIYLSESTARQIDGYHLLRDRGRYRVKGVDERVRVYELLNVGTVLTRFEAMRQRGLSPFIGREAELAALKQGWEQSVVDGQGRLFTVIGGAGVGKSRLCYEFTQWCREQDIMVYSAQGVSYGQGMPYMPIIEFARSYFGLVGDETAEGVAERVTDQLQKVDEALGVMAPAFINFLSEADSEGLDAAMRSDTNRKTLLRAVVNLMSAGAERQPAVFLVEDLHLFDEASTAFVSEIVQALADSANMLLVNSRPEYEIPWAAHEAHRDVDLAPLTAAQASEMAASLLGKEFINSPLIEQIVDRAEGNPYFIEAVIQGLVEDQSLRGSPGRYRQQSEINELKIPGQIQTVLSARIDRLQDDEKRVMQVAAVHGRKVPESILREVSGIDLDALRLALSSLVEDGLLSQEQMYPEPSYSFMHLLAEEVVYGSQLTDSRQKLHAAIALALEARDQEGSANERAAVIAQHWNAAGNLQQAVRWYQTAANVSAYRDLRASIGHWQRILELLEAGGASALMPENLLVKVQARARILHLGARRGLAEAEIEQQLNAALAELGQLSGSNEVSLWHAYLLMAAGSAHAFAGRRKRSAELYEQAREIADESGDVGIRLVSLVGLLYAELSLGKLRNVRRLAQAGISMSGGDSQAGAMLLGRSPLLTLIILKAWAEVESGKLADAGSSLAAAVEQAIAEDDVENLALAEATTGLLAAQQGDFEAAEISVAQSMRIAASSGNVLNSVYGMMVLAWMAVIEAATERDEGDWEAALATVDRALETARSESVGLALEPRLLALRAVALAHRGEYSQARASARESLLLARNHGNLLAEAEAQLARAMVRRLAYGTSSKAAIEKALNAAELLAEKADAMPLVALLKLERSAWLALKGDDAAVNMRAEANQLFLDMGAKGRQITA